MQRITNCILNDKDRLLLLQKPSRNWWVAPGGKMESGESVRDAAIREFREETGITVKKPVIKGIFTFLIIEDDVLVSEWMMFTFHAKDWSGEVVDQSPEGILQWIPADDVADLPMAQGDHYIFQHVLQDDGVLYGTFRYTKEFQLIGYEFQKNE